VKASSWMKSEPPLACVRPPRARATGCQREPEVPFAKPDEGGQGKDRGDAGSDASVFSACALRSRDVILDQLVLPMGFIAGFARAYIG